MKLFLITILMFLACPVRGQDSHSPDPKLMTAQHHPMQYYVSLPHGWTSTKKWPVVVVLEAAEKEYKENIIRFMNARRDMPFILVAPFIVTNGRQGQRDPKIFPYSSSTWDLIDRQGVCDFDLEGLQEVLRDVQRLYNSEDRCSITGFEAGTHLLWAYVFRHPEKVLAAAPVAGNFINRCMDGDVFSDHALRKTLPINMLVGQEDTVWMPGGRLYGQVQAVKSLAVQHGFGRVSENQVAGKAHVPMPAEVLDYFYRLRMSAGR